MAKIQIKNSFITSSAQITISSSLVRFSDNIRAKGITGSFSGSFAGSNLFVQGGNSFGTTALLGTNDNQPLVLETNGSEKLRIISDGNVGIGTSSPLSKLHILGSNGGTDYVYQRWSYTANVGVYDLILKQTVTSGVVRYNFSMNNASTVYNDVLVLDRGCVGIGTSFPLSKLDVRGTMYVNYGSNGTGYIQTNGTDSDLQITTATNLTTLLNTGTSGAMAFGAGNSERMRILSGGNIGIGTTSPTQKLEVAGYAMAGESSYRTSIYGNASGAWIAFGDTSNTVSLGRIGAYNSLFNINSVNGDTSFQYNGSEKMRITTGGNVGIGTSSPTQKLEVIGAGLFGSHGAGTYSLSISNNDQTNARIRITNSGTGGRSFSIVSGNPGLSNAGFAIYDETSAATRMYISGSGNIGIGTTIPTGLLEVYASNNGGLGGFLVLNNNGNAIANETAIIFGDGVSTARRAAISSTTEDSPYYGDLKFKTGLSAYSSLTTRMIIKGAGNVGIGTSSPGNNLVVYNGSGWAGTDLNGTSGGELRFLQSGTLKANIYASTSTALVINSGDATIFQIGASEKMRLTGGNLGIGTTSPTAALEVNGSIHLNGNIRDVWNDNIWNVGQYPYNYSTSPTYYMGFQVETATRIFYISNKNNDGSATDPNGGIIFRTGGTPTNRMIVSYSGNVGIGTNSPAAKLDVAGDIKVGSGTTSTTKVTGSLHVTGSITLNASRDSNWPLLISDPSTVGGSGRYQLNKVGAMGFNYPDSYAQLQIIGASGAYIDLGNSGTDDYDARLIYYTNSRLDLTYGTTMTLNSTGVGIGTTSPNTLLNVHGANPFVRINDTSATGHGIKISYNNSDTHGLHLTYNGNGAQSYIDNTYGVTSGQPYGDIYFRQNVSGVMTTRMTIKADGGSIGIGTTNPTVKLAVSDGTTIAQVNPYSGVAYFGTVNNYPMALSVNSSEKVRIDANGNVGIGTTSPTAKLNVVNTERILGILRAQSTPRTTFYDDTFAVNNDGGGANGFIYTSGTGGTFPLDYYGELIIQAGPRTGYNNGISLVTGTTSPSVKLRVAENGNVGIGTNAPVALLDVRGNTKFGSSLSNTHQFTGSVNFGGSTYNNSIAIDKFEYFSLQPYIEGGSFPSNVFSLSGTFPTFVTMTGSACPFGKVAYNVSYYEAIGDYIPVQAGETLYGEIWAYRSAGATGTAGVFYCGIARYDKDKRAIDGNAGLNYFIVSAATVPSNSTWTKYSNTTTLPLTHTPYAGSDGGPVRYVRPYIIVNYTAGTVPTYWAAFKIRKQQLTRDSGTIFISGSVGIGVSTPAYPLHVRTSANTGTIAIGNVTYPGLISTNAGSGEFRIDNRTSAAAGYITFYPNGEAGSAGSEAMRIITNGNVGIGTSSPAYKLDVNTANDSAIRIRNGGGGANNGLSLSVGSGSPWLDITEGVEFRIKGNTYANIGTWNSGNNTKLLIDSNGNIGIGTTTVGAKFIVNNNGGTGNAFYVDIGNRNDVTTLFEHTGTNTPVPFRLKKSGYSGTASTYGLLYLYMNDGTVGNGSNLYFTANDSAGNEHEYGGLGAHIITNTNGAESGDLVFYTSDAGTIRSEKVRIKFNGNVGIGTTTVGAKLQVQGKGLIVQGITGTPYWNNNSFEIQSSGGNGVALEFHRAGYTSATMASMAGELSFYTDSGSERMRIVTGTGNVGIGTTNPTYKLHLSGSMLITGVGSGFSTPGSEAGYRLKFYDNGGVNNDTGIGLDGGGLGSEVMWFNALQGFYWNIGTGGEKMRLTSVGNLGIGTSVPSATLTVIATNNTGSRIQLGTASNSAYMDANKVNDFMVMTAPFGASPASVSNGGAKWGIKLNGSIDTINTKGKSACIYAVSEENSAGYNRMVGLALHTSAFDLDSAERVRIKNDGNVGIGSTAPNDKLDVVGRVYAYRYIAVSSNASLPAYATDTSTGMFNAATNQIGFTINGTEKLRINTDGNLGIGTTSPAQKLHVVGAVYGTTYGQFGTSVASGTNSSYAVFGSNSAVVGVKINIDSNVNRNDLVVSGSTGNVGIGTSRVLSKLNAYASGSNLSVFRVDGGNGTLFEVTDQLSGSLFSVNDVSGLPLLEVFSNNRVVAGKYGSNALVVSGSSVGIGTSRPAYRLQVSGSFAATTKSFVINHPDPAKSDKQLVHGVTEGPEHTVFVRGKLENNNIIQLPDYWQHLVHEESITVTLTPNKYYQQLYVKNVTDTTIEVGSETDKPINCYYYIVGERKDIPKLITEI